MMLRRLFGNRAFHVIGALIVGAACVWISLRQVEPTSFLAQFSTFSAPLVLLAAATVVLTMAVKALRWQWLYDGAPPPLPWSTHFGILSIGQMLTLVSPLRLGEVARLGLMRQEGRPVGVTFGTIVVEKTLDLLALGVIVLVAVPLALIPSSLRREAGAAGVLLGIVLFVVLLVLGRLERPIVSVLARIPAPREPRLARVFNWARHAISAVLATLASLRGKQLARVGAITACVWLVSLLTTQIMLAAFQVDEGWGAALALMLALTSSNWAPTPPAMIGVVSAVTMAVLASFGIDPARGLALGTLFNVVIVGPPVLIGAIALWLRLWRLGEAVTLAALRRAAGLSRPAEAEAVVTVKERGGGPA